MIPIPLAHRLRDAGLQWLPARGDRFVVLQPDMEQDVFVLSDMTVELHEHPTGRIIGFNGTTEWALDSVGQDQALWLPGEDQLRASLGARLRRLERAGAAGGPGGRWRVELVDGSTFSAADADEAYALALLHELTPADQRPR